MQRIEGEKMDQRFRRDRISEQRREKIKPQNPSIVSVDAQAQGLNFGSCILSCPCTSSLGWVLALSMLIKS